MTTGLLLAAVGLISLGAAGVAARSTFRVALFLQAAGAAVLGAAGFWALAAGGSAGSGFTNAFEPRARRRRQPPPRLPPDQQELRALLRLRRPLMLTLLRDLRLLRRELSLPAPDRGRSLAVRHVEAGSCNGCEHELTFASGLHYDLQRYGFGIVASPRHADVLLVTGPVTTRMREPLLTAYRAMPEPRRVVALGDCALGCGLLGLDSELVGAVEAVLPVDVRIRGCPPRPDAIAAAPIELCDRDAVRGASQPRGSGGPSATPD